MPICGIMVLRNGNKGIDRKAVGTMKEKHYKASEVERMLDTIKDAEITLTAKQAIQEAVDFYNDVACSWLKSDITEKWDADTIAKGIAACKGALDMALSITRRLRDMTK